MILFVCLFVCLFVVETPGNIDLAKRLIQLHSGLDSLRFVLVPTRSDTLLQHPHSLHSLTTHFS